MPDLTKEFPSKWLKVGVDVKHGDIIKFIDAGVVSQDGTDDKGNPRSRLDITVGVEGKDIKKSMTINATNRKRLQKVYGANTDNWVGKSAEIVITKKTNPRTGDLVDAIDLVVPNNF